MSEKWVYCVMGLTVGFATNFLYWSLKYRKGKRVDKKKNESDEVEDVLWSNECTKICYLDHGNIVNDMKYEEYANNSDANKVQCVSRFCSVRNIFRLVSLIDSAKFSIDLAMYTFSSTPLYNAFRRALGRGVLIRIITDCEMSKLHSSKIVPLCLLGATVSYPTTAEQMLMHHKFCIIDGPQRAEYIKSKMNERLKESPLSLLLSGSLNWTKQAFAGNWENVLITSNDKLVHNYEEEFERLWLVFQIEASSQNQPDTP